MLAGLRRGDSFVWEEFLSYHDGLIRMWARNRGCPESSLDDICQETLVALVKGLPTFKHSGKPGSFHAFVRRIVQNKTIDLLRKQHPHSELEVEEHRMCETCACKAWDLPWIQTLLKQSLKKIKSRLDENTWEAFYFYALEGQPVEDVQRQIGIARPGTVYQQKSRVLSLLRKEIIATLERLDDMELSRVPSCRSG
ncbi:MAG: RNA polymerase sigma factor [Lentisphaeria bacterium]|nr:RNA polymerase sigma factor [Lentisphaeria bacterium]